MKRALALLLACALGFGLLAGCSTGTEESLGPICDGFPAAPPSLLWNPQSDFSQPELPYSCFLPAMPVDSFGLELLKQARAASGAKAMASERDHVPFSTLVSPLSVFLTLSLIANGADGNTQTQFLDVLTGGASIDDLNVNCSNFMSEYQGLRGSSQCRLANSLWFDSSAQLRDRFISQCRGVYGAPAYSAELSEPRTVDDINGWVSEHTNKMIPEIISEPFSPETSLVLVNAFYLKNQWQKEFDPLCTRQMDFHHAGGSDSQPDYLQHFDTELSYINGEGAQGAVLPYDDGRLAFFALLPDLYPDSPDLGEWLNGLDGASLTRLIDTREDAQFLRFAMPKFTAEWQGDLSEALSGMGLTDAFVPGTADFSKMGSNPDGYYIDQVIHAVRIEVNEKGTEAAAATAAPMDPGSPPPPEDGITLVLDRPFLYGIVDLQNGVPLFLGTYE